jgi:hypothetical protein
MMGRWDLFSSSLLAVVVVVVVALVEEEEDDDDADAVDVLLLRTMFGGSICLN